MIFIGMDVHVRNSYLHVVDDAGKVLKRGRVGNTIGESASVLVIAASVPVYGLGCLISYHGVRQKVSLASKLISILGGVVNLLMAGFISFALLGYLVRG